MLLLVPLGHQVAYYADVGNIASVSSPINLLTYEQLAEALEALKQARGNRIYTVEVYPEVSAALAADGFKSTLDPASGITEWWR